MVVIAILACVVALAWILILRQRVGAERRPRAFVDLPDEAFDGDFAGSLFETAPIGLMDIDRAGIVRRVNRLECKLRGLDASAMLGLHCTDLLPEAERERFREQIARKMDGGGALIKHLREYVHPNGHSVAVEVHEQLLRSQNRGIAGMRFASIDVTASKKSEEAAYQNSAELRALFQAFPDLFLRLDKDDTVLDVKGGQGSDSFLRPGHFLGRKLQELLPAEAMAQIRQAQGEVRKTNAMKIVEFSMEDRRGTQNYEMRLLPLNWNEWIAIIRDISARKASEQLLKANAQELEQKNDELEKALASAREATRIKSRFLANISHEIRTPLNGVLGMTDFLLSTALEPEQRECGDCIKRSADTLLALINDFLDLSEIDSGKFRLNRKDFALPSVISEIASLFAVQAHAKDLEFISEISPDLPEWAVGDQERLRQILVNLLGNAVKFTQSGQVGLKVETLDAAANAIRLKFTVHDTGIGIPRSEQERLFDIFTQVDDSNSRKYGGTGLGLAISKQLVRLLEGEIGMSSEPGQGSQFWFTASFGKAAPRAVQTTASVALAVRSTTPRLPAPAPLPAAASSFEALRILLVEDNVLNQRITLRLLQRLGLSADVAMNGREAVEAVEKRRYQLVLMDCQMPEMDGFEATAVIRNREMNSRQHQTICALTANAMEGDRERCLAAGMDDYISKPVGLEKLRDTLDRWIPGVGAHGGGEVSV